MLDTRPRFRRGSGVHLLDLCGLLTFPDPRWPRVLLMLPGPVWPAGLHDDDGPAGGAADGAGFVVELDCERVLGDADGDGAPGVDAPERDLLAADDDHAGGADATLNGDRLGLRPWRRAGGAGALGRAGLRPGGGGWGGC